MALVMADGFEYNGQAAGSYAELVAYGSFGRFALVNLVASANTSFSTDVPQPAGQPAGAGGVRSISYRGGSGASTWLTAGVVVALGPDERSVQGAYHFWAWADSAENNNTNVPFITLRTTGGVVKVQAVVTSRFPLVVIELFAGGASVGVFSYTAGLASDYAHYAVVVSEAGGNVQASLWRNSAEVIPLATGGSDGVGADVATIQHHTWAGQFVRQYIDNLAWFDDPADIATASLPLYYAQPPTPAAVGAAWTNPADAVDGSVATAASTVTASAPLSVDYAAFPYVQTVVVGVSSIVFGQGSASLPNVQIAIRGGAVEPVSTGAFGGANSFLAVAGDATDVPDVDARSTEVEALP